MKQFFSIVINHEYDRVDENTRGVSNDLAIVPANTNGQYTNNNRLWFRSQIGGLICYIEDDEAFKNETAVLFFWVVCINEAFYSYTDYPRHINFSNPYYYWSNSEAYNTLQQDDQCYLHPGRSSKQAVGCIGILISDIITTEKLEFTVDFKVRKTYWEYHIMTNEDPKDKTYTIIDLNFPPTEEKQMEATHLANNTNTELDTAWEFEKISDENATEIIFQSKTPLAYTKIAQKRLEFRWGPKQKSNLVKGQKMTLPFANYEYKMVNKDNKELTPIYIHI